MKSSLTVRISGLVLAVTSTMAGTALAHPGNHGVGEAAQSWLHGFLHFFTHIDHIAPVIACVFIVVGYRHRVTLLAFAKRHIFGRKP